uniref:Sugar transporter ERD6-like protein 6 n=1 Tax=Aegilops tauschii TaxID=37682 RepID=M8AWX9_AEGTA
MTPRSGLPWDAASARDELAAPDGRGAGSAVGLHKLRHAGSQLGPSQTCELIFQALMIAAIPNILGWLAISSAKDTTFLYMGRLLEGFGVGIISYTVPVYIAEISPQNKRGALGCVNPLSVTIGMVLAYVLGMLVPWRMLAVIGALPCTILIPGLFFIPESPRSLAKMNKMDDFEASLQVLRGSETDITSECSHQCLLSHHADSGSISKQNDVNPFPRVKTKEILHAPHSNFLDLLSILASMFDMKSPSGLTNSNLAACGLGAIAISSAGMTLSLLAVAVIFFLKDNVPQDSDMYYILSLVSLLAIVAYVFTFSFGMGAIPWVIMSEILPVSIKSLAGSFATLANWLTSFGITMTANLLLSWSAGGTFACYTLVSAFTLVFIILWVPETKGRTLEEIQWSFRFRAGAGAAGGQLPL